MQATSAKPAPSIKINPLLKYTLQGEAQALEEMAVEQRPLLGSFCLSGQASVLAAPPNCGKTLITLSTIIEAVEAGRVRGEDVFYVDADDTTQGIADKVRLLDEYGVNVVAEGFNGFKATLLAAALEEMIEGGTARGKVLVLDTFKKFAQLMSKAETTRFTEMVRRFILAGGTMLCLAHTNKNQDAKGRNVFAGVMDIFDDLDCAYVLDVRDEPNGKRIVQFTNKKRRGNNPDVVTYAYQSDPDLSYIERLTSVHETDAYDGGADDGLDHQTSDEEVIYSLSMHILHGQDRGKMELVRLVAGDQVVSKRRVLKLLEAHTGDDPAEHLWRYVVRARGLKAYELLGPLPAPPA